MSARPIHLQLRGNLVPEAYLAALALEQGAELITFDRGFGRYPRLRWRCLLDTAPQRSRPI